MRTIWKYDLKVGDDNTLSMPVGAQVLHVADQNGVPDTIQLWADVETTAELETREFLVFGTGHRVTGADFYLGTVITAGGALVWHVYGCGEF